jgi:hypothetical protein
MYAECLPTSSSSDLWVWSSEFAKASKYPGHTIYNPTKSSTAKKASGTWNISYGDGSSARSVPVYAYMDVC